MPNCINKNCLESLKNETKICPYCGMSQVIEDINRNEILSLLVLAKIASKMDGNVHEFEEKTVNDLFESFKVSKTEKALIIEKSNLSRMDESINESINTFRSKMIKVGAIETLYLVSYSSGYFTPKKQDFVKRICILLSVSLKEQNWFDENFLSKTYLNYIKNIHFNPPKITEDKKEEINSLFTKFKETTNKIKETSNKFIDDIADGIPILSETKERNNKSLRDYSDEIKKLYIESILPIIIADDVIDAREVFEIYKMYADLSIPFATRKLILEQLFMSHIDIEEIAKERFDSFNNKIKTFHQSESDKIRFGLYKDLISLATIDNFELTDSEEKVLNIFKNVFNINNKQDEEIRKFVLNYFKLVKGEIKENEYIENSKELLSLMGGFGIPMTALFFSGTVVGLSGAGILSGLAAIGGLIAFIPGLNAATAGIALLGVTGLGVYKGINYFTGQKKREKNQLLKDAFENYQKASTIIKEDINRIADQIITHKAKNETTIIDNLEKQSVFLSKILDIALEEQVKIHHLTKTT